MKATELRIGNWYKSVKFNVLVICELADLYELCIKSDGAYNDPPIEEMFESIPLTEEWLLKFGFEATHENRYGWFVKRYGCPNEEVCLLGINYKSGIISIENFDDDSTLPCYGGFQIQYVHQLQNLYFALTGEELKIN